MLTGRIIRKMEFHIRMPYKNAKLCQIQFTTRHLLSYIEADYVIANINELLMFLCNLWMSCLC